MIELPDDELDKLFRKSSEELDPTYEPDDWNDLRKRLDQQDGKTPAGWWRKWWPLGVLALLVPIGLVLYSWVGEDGATVERRKEKSGVASGSGVVAEGNGAEDGAVDSGVKEDEGLKAAGTVENGDAIVDNGISGVDNATKSGAENSVVDRNGKAIGNKLKTSVNQSGKSSSTSELNAAVGNNGRKPLPRSRSKAGGVFLEPNRSKVEGGDGALSLKNNANAVGSETSLPQQTGQPIATDEAVARAEEPGRTAVFTSALSSKGLRWNALTLPGISEPVYELPEPPAPPKPSSLSADDQPLVAVRFGYSPDLSTVGLKDFTKPGTSVSLLVEYSVLPRLYLQSGMVWSRKDYYAPAEAYQLPKHGYYPPLALSGIDGVCKVLEIPLNVRFDISSGERSRWFATGGFSSYHMNSEKYKYHYIDPKDPNAQTRKGWNGNTGWYLLSHANVSAGYEYRISRKLSLLAEPSIRMPLKRVGYGKVNLITTGLWLSVRYTPVFK